MNLVARVEAAYRRIAEVDRPEIWILLGEQDEALRAAAEIESRVAAGEVLPLAGTLLAVKDNIDVAGLPTTAGCPAYAYLAEASAPCVQRLLEAGALVLGKTNLDQFATGLVGTRSPYGAVRDARRPEYVSGGSSSGSAVAVALGIVDIALGTDTAGSGRVPAAFGGIVGLKPTYGLVPTRGVVPACREFDCVSVFARTVPRLAVPRLDQLASLSRGWATAWELACDRWEALGATLVYVDISDLLTAGSLLYGGAFIASRYAAVGAFIDEHPADVDPTVRTLVSTGRDLTAAQWVADTERLATYALSARAIFADCDALVLPTVSSQPTIAAVAADPIGVNATLGEFTTFCNLLDLAAIAVPAGEVEGGCFGMSIVVPAFHDRVAADLARRYGGEAPLTSPPAGIAFLVVGAHLTGMPLNSQLTERGCRLIGEAQTAASYRLYALDTQPPKPGLHRVDGGGASITGELWDVPLAALGDLLAMLPPPMALGPVELADGSLHVGFQCEAVAIETATDITDYGGWRAYRADVG
jgi:allophanate hydrolase